MAELGLHHVSLVVTDLERSVTFYQDLFGLERMQRPAFSVAGAWLATGAQQVHLIAYPGGTFRSGPVDTDDAHFAMNTRDFDGFMAKAADMGFREDAAEDHPLRIIVRRKGLAGFPQAYLLDPDRNIVEVNGAS
jgi:glyoxylase I family protein